MNLAAAVFASDLLTQVFWVDPKLFLAMRTACEKGDEGDQQQKHSNAVESTARLTSKSEHPKLLQPHFQEQAD